MIKIVHIIGRLGYGGAEKLLLDLCRRIDKEKFSVSVIVMQADNPLATQFADAGVEVKYFVKKRKGDRKLIKDVANYLREIKPDIVHTHLFVADFYGSRAARMAGVKHIISTKHDLTGEDFLRGYFYRKTHRAMDKVIAISEAARRYVVTKEKVPVERIELIYNGIDINKFYVAEPRILQKNGLAIGSVGRLSKEKGHKHLIRACCFLKNKEWTLTLVGDGPLRRELESMARFLGVDEKVKFIGTAEDVRPYLNEWDVFVLPSISEGLSLALLEAAASGRVVVATNVGGVPEIITDRENGLLFKPKNIEQLTRHLNWIDENREAATVMAERLQKEVASRFDLKDIIKKYEKLYENIAGQ